MLKTISPLRYALPRAYHLGEGRVLKTDSWEKLEEDLAYHLGEGRVLKTFNDRAKLEL